MSSVVGAYFVLTGAAQARVAPGTKVRLITPPPGKVELERVEVRVVAHPGHRLPAHLKLGVRRLNYTNTNLVIFEGTGVARRTAREVDFDLLFTLIRSRTAIRAAHAAEVENPLEGIYDFVTHFFVYGPSDMSHGQVRTETLNDLFTGTTSARNLLSSDAPGDHAPGDESLDTGHYDDGHSFGWKPQTANHIMADSWTKLANGQFAQDTLNGVIQEIENDLSHRVTLDGAQMGASTCSGTGTTPSQTLTEPPPPSTYSNYDFATDIPSKCNIALGKNSAIYLVSDSNGSVLACLQDPGVAPPPGQSACPGGAYSGLLPGDPRSTVVITDPTVPSGDSVWHIPVAVSRNNNTGTPTSAHLVYRWQVPG